MRLAKSIVLEGFDNSGKSTLAKQLCNILGAPLYRSGGAPKTAFDYVQFLAEHLRIAKQATVIDRVTCISHPIYNAKLSAEERVFANHCLKLMRDDCVFVYCRPPLENILDFSGHVVKDYDTPEQVQWLKNNASRIVKAYDYEYEDWGCYGLTRMAYDYSNMSINYVMTKLHALGALEN